MLVGTASVKRRRFRADPGARFASYLGAAAPAFLVGDLLRRAISSAGSST